MLTVSKTQGNIEAKGTFKNYQLHIEWRIPENITGSGQAQGNSGVELPVITVHRVLLRHGLVRREDRHAAAVQRFGRAAPNELWQMDSKSPKGWEQAVWPLSVVDDALLTALCMVGFAMLMGAWKPQHPWSWVLLVWVGVPVVLADYAFVVKWPHDRRHVYGTFLQLLAASAGGFGSPFMRQMIDPVFLKKDD